MNSEQKSPFQEGPAIDANYEAMRLRALKLTAVEVGISADSGGPDVWGMVIDFPTPSTVATLVVTLDGTVSLYLGVGHFMVGAGEHTKIARAAQTLLSDAQAWSSRLEPATDLSPAQGECARVFLLTSSGIRSSELHEMDSGKANQDLAELIRKADDVVTAIREVDESQGGQRFGKKDNVLQVKVVVTSLVLGAVVGGLLAPVRLPGILTGGVIGLIAGFLGSGILLMVLDAMRRRGYSLSRRALWRMKSSNVG